jgi:hypothetical protein
MILMAQTLPSRSYFSEALYLVQLFWVDQRIFKSTTHMKKHDANDTISEQRISVHYGIIYYTFTYRNVVSNAGRFLALSLFYYNGHGTILHRRSPSVVKVQCTYIRPM